MWCHCKLGVEVISKSLTLSKKKHWCEEWEASSFHSTAQEACLNFLTVDQDVDKDVNDGACGISDNLPKANNINHHNK